MTRQAACAALLATLLAAPVAADPMRPLPAPPSAASAPQSAPLPAAATAPAVRREAAPAVQDKGHDKGPDMVKDVGRLVAIREDSRGRRQALIGERWVAEGDSLEHAVVRHIDHNSVELTAGRARTVLHLLPPLVASDTPAPATLATATGGARLQPDNASGGPLPARPQRSPLRRTAPPNTTPPEGPSP